VANSQDLCSIDQRSDRLSWQIYSWRSLLHPWKWGDNVLKRSKTA